jgi:hypothetical protein
VADNAILDGIKGSLQFNDGRWQGYQGADLEAVIDLEDTMSISKISPEFIQAIGSWVFLPTSVNVSVSMDGKEYSPIADIVNTESIRQTGAFTKSFIADAGGKRARFIRVRAKNIGVCPEGHPGAGQKAWMFVDEIVVE